MPYVCLSCGFAVKNINVYKYPACQSRDVVCRPQLVMTADSHPVNLGPFLLSLTCFVGSAYRS